MDSNFTFCSFRVYYTGVQMAGKKNKKKRLMQSLILRWFPGYDLYFTIVIMLLMVILATCTGCYSPDTVYVREYYSPRPFGTSLYIHHNHHYDHHNHYRQSNRRSSRPAGKVVTPTRNPTPPPSRPISKGVPEPPSNPRDRR